MSAEAVLKKKIERLKKANQILEKQTENKTRELYEKFQEVGQIYDSLPSCIFILNDDGKFQFTNANAKEIVGSCEKFENLVTKKLDIKRLSRAVDLAKSGSESEIQLTINTGESKPLFLCTFKPLKGSSGSKILIVANEITELKNEEMKRAELQAQLMERSYKEGMAENATSILHNIGNILTGMTGAISRPRGLESAKSGIDSLNYISENMVNLKSNNKTADFFSNEENVSKFIELIQNVSKEVTDFVQEVEGSFESVKEKVNHIGSIISVQQQYAKLKSGIKTSISLTKVIEDALLINEAKLTRPHIHVNKNFEDDITVQVEKNGFIQTLTNIFVNAVESIEKRIMEDPKYGEGEINISYGVQDEKIVIQFSDDGYGFGQEVKKKLFKFGFSTKERSSGFGLHNCMNFMRSQGGDFIINSEGELRGAEIKLVLPLETEA